MHVELAFEFLLYSRRTRDDITTRKATPLKSGSPLGLRAINNSVFFIVTKQRCQRRSNPKTLAAGYPQVPPF